MAPVLPEAIDFDLEHAGDGYVVSICGTRGRQPVRRLHYFGRGFCGRTPGVDYKSFQWLGPRRPDVTEYHKICKMCWPTGLPELSDTDDSAVTEGGETDEEA